MNPLLALLMKEVGPALAGKIWEYINTEAKDHIKKIDQATKLCEKGLSAVSALSKIFGKQFYEILNDAIDSGGTFFSYEAGRQNYIHLNYENADNKKKIQLLRDELNINLDRIVKMYSKENDAVLNHFKGCFSQWIDNFKKHFSPINKDEKKIIETIFKLLDGKKRTANQIFRMIRQTSLGATGALMILYGILIGLGVGVGLMAKIELVIFGIPGGQVLGFVVGGVILAGLALIQFKNRDVMSTCVSIAYKILDNRL
jgi:hypothetical protein